MSEETKLEVEQHKGSSHPRKIKDSQVAWYLKNKENHNQYMKEYHARRKLDPAYVARRKMKSTLYYKSEKGKIKRKAYRVLNNYDHQYYEKKKHELAYITRRKAWRTSGGRIYIRKPEVRERRRIRMSNKRKLDEGFGTACKIRDRLRGALNGHKIKKDLTTAQYGVNIDNIIKYIGKKPEDTEVYEIDHLVPIYYFDLHYPEHIRAAFKPQNHQWLEKSKNREKSNKIIQLPEKIEMFR